MKFKFRLERVLRHRKTLQDLARKEFEDAQAKLDEETNLQNKMIQDIEDAKNIRGAIEIKLAGKETDKDQVGKLQQIHEYLILRAFQRDQQNSKIEQARLIVEKKQDFLREKAIDRKILEKVREKKKDEFVHEVNRQEQIMLDEIATMRASRLEKEK